MVGRRNHDDVARQVIDLEQKGAHDPLDLTRVVRVTPLLAQGVELVERQGRRSDAVA